MFRVIVDARFRIIEIVSQKRQIRPACRVACQILDGAVHGLYPSVFVRGKLGRVIQICLD